MTRSSLGRPWTLPMESLRPKRTAAAKEEKSSSNPGSPSLCPSSGFRHHLSHFRRRDPKANVVRQDIPKCMGSIGKKPFTPLIPVRSNKGLLQPVSFLNNTKEHSMRLLTNTDKRWEKCQAISFHQSSIG